MQDCSVESNRSRRKLGVILVLLLLAVSSLIGVGYAYSSSVTHSGSAGNTAVLLAVNGNEGSPIEFTVDWRSSTTGDTTVWTVEKDVSVDFTMGYVKTARCDFDGSVLVNVSAMMFAYDLTIGSNETIHVAAGEALVDHPIQLTEGLTADAGILKVTKDTGSSWDSPTQSPESSISFFIRATTVDEDDA